MRRKSLRASPVEAVQVTPQLERTHFGRASRSVEKADTTVGELAVGNRIISLEVLTETLLPHARCPKCENWGTLTPSMGGERGQGLAGVLRFFCRRCDKLTLDMPTSLEQVRGHKCGPAQAGLNLRACLAAVHCGIGYEHVCRFMGLMNLPAPAESTYQRAEDKMNKVMLEVGAESMQRALAAERTAALAVAGPSMYDQHRVNIDVCADTQWMKCGRAHNAADGYTPAMGGRNRQVIDAEYCTKYGPLTNHKGSSGSMEPI